MTEAPPTLSYQVTPPQRRVRAPWWVWVVVVIYALLFLAMLALPAWVAFDWRGNSDTEFIGAVCTIIAILAACGLALMFTPVRQARQRPLTRKSVLIPLIASGLLLGVLMSAAGFAVAELAKAGDAFYWAAVIGGGVVWIGWSIVLWLATRTNEPTSLAVRLHRWLLLGSVAELLIAVSSHIIVRRRTECCAGIMTGTAICTGVLVMIVAFGPSVLLLYLKRTRQISNGRP